ncbi:MAG: Cu-processing system permease protein [Polaribacter sp.]
MEEFLTTLLQKTHFYNSINISRAVVLLKLDISALLGYTGAVFQKLFGTNLEMFVSNATLLLLLWIVLPTLRIVYKSKKKYF